jgi:hypothetical protein
MVMTCSRVRVTSLSYARPLSGVNPRRAAALLRLRLRVVDTWQRSAAQRSAGFATVAARRDVHEVEEHA